MNNKRPIKICVLIAFLLTFGLFATGCAAPQPNAEGYVAAGANAKPAKKGAGLTAEAP